MKYIVLLCAATALLAQQQQQFSARAPSYTLGAGDEILVRAVDVEEFGDKPVRIAPDGFINLPMIGRIETAGLSIEGLESEITRRLKEFIKEPHATVTVVEYRSQPVSVIGSVGEPGVHQLQGRKTLYEVLSLAGGPKNDAGDVLTITRKKEHGPIPLPNSQLDVSGQYYTAEVNLKSLLSAKSPQENIVIYPNDVVSIPRAELIYVLGEVKRAGGFILDQGVPASVLQALTMAGGNEKMAHLSKAMILRVDPASKTRQGIPVDLAKILKGQGEDIRMKPEDILYIPHNNTKAILVRATEMAAGMGSGIAIWRAGQNR